MNSYAKWEEPSLNERPELLTELHEKYKKLDRPDARPVRLTVLRNNFEIGSDMGLVDFVDGTLRYDGLRTQFQVARQSVVLVDEPFFGLTRTFRIGAAEDRHEIILKPIDKLDPDNYYSIVGVYKKGLKDWLGSKATGATELLPPNRTQYASDVKFWRGRGEGIGALLLGAIVLSSQWALKSGMQWQFWLILGFGAFLGALLFRKRKQYLAKFFDEQLIDTSAHLQRNEDGQ
jgi:hypothetical protein